MCRFNPDVSCMKYLLIFLLIICASSCANRLTVKTINVTVVNDFKIFNSSPQIIKNSLLRSLEYRAEQLGQIPTFSEVGSPISVILLTDSSKFNSSWMFGDGYERTVKYKLLIDGNIIETKVTVNTSKDGAVDRVIGSLTGNGSHPGRYSLPGAAGVVIDKIALNIMNMITFPHTHTNN